jgi:hypothetical protein
MHVFSTEILTVLSRLLSVHRRLRRSLHFRWAVATASLSRGSASAGRSPNLIRSGLRDRTAEAGGNLYRRAPAALRSAMAILVTTEQRRPGDGAIIGYILIPVDGIFGQDRIHAHC